LWLLEGLSEQRMVASLYLTTSLQGLPQSSMQTLARYEPLLSGHPALATARAEAAVAIAYKSPDDVRDTWIKQALSSAAIAARWSPGQNRDAYRALLSMGIPSPESGMLVDAYGYDYPRRPWWSDFFYSADFNGQRQAFALEALAFSSIDVTPLSRLPPGNQPGQAGPVLAALGARFTGNPQRPDPSLPAVTGDARGTPAFVALLRKQLASDPEPWESYSVLAEAILESGGSYTEASKLYLSYPGFHERSPDDPVAISNYAHEAGSVFYWAGFPELARPLFDISARLHTGSNSSMNSQARLLIFKRDYAGAAEVLQERALRYPSSYTYRDYLSLLHAFGQHDEAWKAFSQVQAAFDLPHVWISALIGQQMQGLNPREVRDWLLQPDIREAQYQALHFAPYYALLWSLIDGGPAADLGERVEQLEGKPVAHIDSDGEQLLAPHPLEAKNFMFVRHSPFRQGKSPKLAVGTPVKSDLAYFAAAYAPLSTGDYAKSAERFVAMADRYPIEGWPLSYFAYASAKSGDHEHLQTYLEDGWKGYKPFDYWLARAVFAGVAKDANSAFDLLQKAFRMRRSTDNDHRPTLIEYQYAQACEWLYRETGDARFSKELLQWVRKYQVIVPTQGWAYAMEYAYQKPGPERVRALAMTRYLDPKSKRIQGAPTDEVKAADAWLHANNPFRIPGAHSNLSKTVAAR
jgi:tetratricopeptide (TPR) repeat protein